MKVRAALLLFAAATVTPDIRHFQYLRPVDHVSQQPGLTCIPLDAALYARGSAGLADVRLFRGRQETPYVVETSSANTTKPQQPIQLLNMGSRDGQTVFDAAMPPGSYSDLLLNVKGQDFIATVTVSGGQQQAGPVTRVGAYTIFDLTRQRLGRSTVLHLPPSDFRYLHFRIAGPLRPVAIEGLSVQQVPAIKPEYTVVAESKQVRLRDDKSIVEFTVPAHVPVERVLVVPGPEPANFSRDAVVEVRPMAGSPNSESVEAPVPISMSGNLLRVHTIEENQSIDQERLELDAPPANFDSPSKWTISVDNGDNPPLVPESVRLEMLSRDLCFQSAGGTYALYYGDPKLSAPRYDLGQFLVVHIKDAALAVAGPEESNPQYEPRPDDRPFTERHPVLLWVALALVVVLLGAIALRTAKSTKPQQG